MFFLCFLLVVSLACGLGSALQDNSGNTAEEPDNTDDEPLAEEPTQVLQATSTPEATMTAMRTGLPDTGGGDDSIAPTPVAVSMDFNTLYARLVEELPRGSALFNPPASMRVGEVKLVEVRIVPMTEDEIEEDETIRATLVSDLDEEVDEVIVIPLRVSTVMRARLAGASFEINPLKAEEQIRTSDDLYLSWIWEVTPQKSGEHTLTLFLSVVVNAEGMGEKTHTTSEVRTVQVRANPIYSLRQFFGTNWEWVATGLLFPVVGWAWRKYKNMRQS